MQAFHLFRITPPLVHSLPSLPSLALRRRDDLKGSAAQQLKSITRFKEIIRSSNFYRSTELSKLIKIVSKIIDSQKSINSWNRFRTAVLYGNRFSVKSYLGIWKIKPFDDLLFLKIEENDQCMPFLGHNKNSINRTMSACSSLDSAPSVTPLW